MTSGIIKSYTSDMKMANRMYVVYNRKNLCWLSWHPPLDHWVKLNTNGSFMENSKSAGAGGAIQDSRGKWLIGFF